MLPSKQLRLSFELNTENNGNGLQPPQNQIVDDENVLNPPMNLELPGGENHDVNNIQLAAEPDNLAGRVENEASQDLANYVANYAEEVFYLAIIPNEFENDANISRVMSPSEQLRFELNSEELNTENDGNGLQPPEYQIGGDDNVLIPPMNQELPGDENHDVNNIQLAAEPDNVAGRDENGAFQDLANYVANFAEEVFYLKMVPQESKNNAVVANGLRAKKRPNEDNLENPNLTELEKELAKPAPKKQPARPESPKVQEAEMPSIDELDAAPGLPGELLVPRNENENTENDGNELQHPQDQLVDDENVLNPPRNLELPGGENHDVINIQLAAEPDNLAGRVENEASQDLANYVANSAEEVFYLAINPNEFENDANISRVMSPSEQLRFELNTEELNTENDGNGLQPPEYQTVGDDNMLIPLMNQELPGDENHDVNNIQLAAEPDNVAGRDENGAFQDLANYAANSAEEVFYLEMVPQESKNDAVAANGLRAKKRPNEDNLENPNLTELEKELAKPAPKRQPSKPESPKVQEAEMPSIDELDAAPGSPGELLVPRNENENIWLFPDMPILSPCESDSSDSCSCNSSIVSDSCEDDVGPIYIFSSELARVIQAADSTEERVVHINNITDSIPNDACETFWDFETVQESDISSTSPEDEN